MSITLTFYTIAERKPKHHESVIWLENTTSFHMEGFTPREITAEYTWIGIDDDGYETGSDACYNGETEEESRINGYKLAIQFDSYLAQDDFLWCSVDDYWKAFKEYSK